jgi:hypothetical protein
MGVFKHPNHDKMTVSPNQITTKITKLNFDPFEAPIHTQERVRGEKDPVGERLVARVERRPGLALVALGLLYTVFCAQE